MTFNKSARFPPYSVKNKRYYFTMSQSMLRIEQTKARLNPAGKRGVMKIIVQLLEIMMKSPNYSVLSYPYSANSVTEAHIAHLYVNSSTCLQLFKATPLVPNTLCMRSYFTMFKVGCCKKH